MTTTPTGDDASARLPANLRALREYRDLSQAAVAREMARRNHPWHQQTVAKVEAGRQEVGFGEAVDLAGILGVSLDRLSWASEEMREAGLLDGAAAAVRQAWHEASDAVVRLQASLAAGARALESARTSKYEHVRLAAGELEAEMKQSSLEIALSDGLARYENPEEP